MKRLLILLLVLGAMASAQTTKVDLSRQVRGTLPAANVLSGTISGSKCVHTSPDGTKLTLVSDDCGSGVGAKGEKGDPGPTSAGEISLASYGANGDKKTYESCSMTAGSKTLTCATIFASSDVGKNVLVMRAGTAGTNLVSTITTFNSSTSVVLADAAVTTVSGVGDGLPNYHEGVIVGTTVDDTAAFAAALAACRGGQTLPRQGGCTLKVPLGVYALNATQIIANWNASNVGNRITIECVGGYNSTLIVWTGADAGVAFQVDDTTMKSPSVSILNCGWRGVDSIHTFTPMLVVGGISHEFSRNHVGPYVKYGANWSQTWLGKIEFNTFAGQEEAIRFDNACNTYATALGLGTPGCPVNGVTVAHNEIAMNTNYAIHSLATGQGGSNGNAYERNDFEGVGATSKGSLVINDSDSRVTANRFEDSGSTDPAYRSMIITGGRNQIAFNSTSNVAVAYGNRLIANFYGGWGTFDVEVLNGNNAPVISVAETLPRSRVQMDAGTTAIDFLQIGSGEAQSVRQTFYDNGNTWFKEAQASDNPHKIISQRFYTTGGYYSHSFAPAAVVGGKTAPNTPAGATFGGYGKGITGADTSFVFNQSFDDQYDSSPLSDQKVFGWVCESASPGTQCVSTGSGNYSSGTWREVGTIRSNKVREGTAAPTTGTWNAGDFVWKTNPTGTSPVIGWVNTVAGTPGTWVAVNGGPSGFASPLTTKGDLLGYSSTNARIPVGADSQCLVADSAQTLGLKWAACGTGGGSSYTNLFQNGDSLEQRNGLNPQKHRFYSHYTDASNNDFLEIDTTIASGVVAQIKTVKQGTGTAPRLDLLSGTNSMYLGLSGAAWLELATNSISSYGSNNTVDLGQFGNGWYFRKIKAATSLHSPVLVLETKAAYTCDSTTRGQFNYIAGATGVKDIVQICQKDAADAYAWVSQMPLSYLDTDPTAAANSDTRVMSQKAVKTLITSSSGSSRSWATGAMYNGIPPAGYVLMDVYIPTFSPPVSIVIPASCSGAVLKGKTSAAATTTFLVAKNGTTICTATVAAGSVTATWTGSGATITSGDELTLTGGGDANFANVSATIPGSY